MPAKNPSTRLPQLRVALDRSYQRHHSGSERRSVGLHVLLQVPLPERLILLAKIDGADAKEIKRLLGATDEDVALTSPRMIEAARAMQQAIRSPFDHWPDSWFTAPLLEESDITLCPRRGYLWNERFGHDVEQALQQLLFASSAVGLVGEGMVPELSNMTLAERLIAYCLLVEGSDWEQIQGLLGCSSWMIRQTIDKTMQQLGGI